MMFKLKNILGTQCLTEDDITTILDTVDSFKEISTRPIKKVPTLRGKTVINLFFEPSTRTRTSFEIAGKRLSADVINIAGSSSSTVKEENLIDTALNLEAMHPDIMIVRHALSGAAEMISQFIECPIINAGDGYHEHPTQALLDLYTIRESKRNLEGLNVVIVGDIAHSRVVRSNIYAMKTMGMNVKLIGPPTMIPLEIEKMGVSVNYYLEDAIPNADVIMMLRLQKERQSKYLLSSIREYSNLYCLTSKFLEKAKDDVLIFHPGPINRGIEISLDVMQSDRSLILNQVTNGVALRMALMYLVLGGNNDRTN